MKLRGLPCHHLLEITFYPDVSAWEQMEFMVKINSTIIIGDHHLSQNYCHHGKASGLVSNFQWMLKYRENMLPYQTENKYSTIQINFLS